MEIFFFVSFYYLLFSQLYGFLRWYCIINSFDFLDFFIFLLNCNFVPVCSNTPFFIASERRKEKVFHFPKLWTLKQKKSAQSNPLGYGREEVQFVFYCFTLKYLNLHFGPKNGRKWTLKGLTGDRKVQNQS